MRRKISKLALATAAASLFCIVTNARAQSSSAASATVSPFTLHDLGHGAWAAIDNPAAKSARAGSNAGFYITPDGVLVVDTFENPAAARDLLAVIRQKTSAPIRFVVNTHYHLDHVAGNNIFAAAGAVVMAQENVRSWERTENAKFFGPKITPEQKQMVTSLGLPSLTYETGVNLYLGSERIEVFSLPGHTGGDSIIHIPAANVVFMGDLFWNHTLPNLIDASTGPWIQTLDTVLKRYPDATFVPGHGGELGKAEDVKAFRNYLNDLRDYVASAQRAGKAGDALVDTVLPELKQKYGNWDFFGFAKFDIQYTDQELRGTKRIPRPPDAE